MPSRTAWKISVSPREFPSEGAWTIMREHGVVAIGWDTDARSARAKDVREFHRIRKGDIILAYRGNFTIKAVGIAAETPQAYAEDSKMSRLFANQLVRVGRVDWIIVRDMLTRGLPIPSTRVRGLSWNDTVHRLTPARWEQTKAFLGLDW